MNHAHSGLAGLSHAAPGEADGGGGVLLTLNAGSSSLKAALFALPDLEREFSVNIAGIGTAHARFCAHRGRHDRPEWHSVFAPNFTSAAELLVAWFTAQGISDAVKAVGHRVVHGGVNHQQPAVIEAGLLRELRTLVSLDPDHLPAELDLIELLQQRFPVPQVACFDTAFHRTIPPVASTLPIPRRFDERGVRRYGFHGISCAFLIEQLARLDPAAAEGRVVLAHLGSGASLTATRNGRSVDTTMGFTPAGGVPMGTRSGDIDPGIAWFLMHHEQVSPPEFNELMNHHSGLRGISDSSGDMRELLQREATDPRAANAIAVFCYDVRKAIGSLAAALGGIDTLVFSGGIGENVPVVRERICASLAFLGLELEPRRNLANEPIISPNTGRVTVRVIPTDEELIIARDTWRVISNSIRTPSQSAPP